MKEMLECGLTQLSISYSDDQVLKLLRFVELLSKWNKVYNLTAVRDSQDMVSLHLLDSLSLLPYIQPVKRILDVGSGAGLPGIPLAIFSPEKQFVLLDSNVKKTRFIQQVIVDMKLANVRVVHERVEKYHPKDQFDCITTRAFATIEGTLPLVKHLLEKNAQILFMKSNTVESELEQLDPVYSHEIKELSVPGIEATRRLVVLHNQY